MSHTPGPWTARQRSAGYPDYAGGPVIRLWDVYGPDGLVVSMGTINPTGGNEANAGLIAAAPDLHSFVAEIAKIICLRAADAPRSRDGCACDPCRARRLVRKATTS